MLRVIALHATASNAGLKTNAVLPGMLCGRRYGGCLTQLDVKACQYVHTLIEVCALRVPAEAAVGRLSADLLCPYPPGVPVALPGEVLTRRALAVLRGVLAGGGKVTGATDEELGMLSIIVERG